VQPFRKFPGISLNPDDLSPRYIDPEMATAVFAKNVGRSSTL
jgi:hypothetical protein